MMLSLFSCCAHGMPFLQTLGRELGRLNDELNVLVHDINRVQAVLSTAQDPPSRIFNGCSNLCWHASDGHCDDGGLGSVLPSKCDYGSDCSDCGVRAETTTVCTDTCRTAKDGICQDESDDVGDVADRTCAFGTDCSDCAPRNITSYGKVSWFSMWSYSYDDTYSYDAYYAYSHDKATPPAHRIDEPSPVPSADAAYDDHDPRESGVITLDSF